LKFSKRRLAVRLRPICTIMVATKLDHSGVLVTKFHQNQSTLKGRSAGQTHTDRQTRLKIRALQVCNRAKNVNHWKAARHSPLHSPNKNDYKHLHFLVFSMHYTLLSHPCFNADLLNLCLHLQAQDNSWACLSPGPYLLSYLYWFCL